MGKSLMEDARMLASLAMEAHPTNGDVAEAAWRVGAALRKLEELQGGLITASAHALEAEVRSARTKKEVTQLLGQLQEVLS